MKNKHLLKEVESIENQIKDNSALELEVDRLKDLIRRKTRTQKSKHFDFNDMLQVSDLFAKKRRSK